MADSHVSDQDVGLFVSCRLEKAAFGHFLWHVRRCNECRRKLARYLVLLDVDEPTPPEALEEAKGDYDAVLDRVQVGLGSNMARWAEEKSEFGRMMQRVRERPYEGSLEIFDDLAEETHGWAWIEGLLELSFELRYREPEEMRFLLWGASKAVRRIGTLEIDRGRYTPAQLSDLRARVLVELANAERLNHSYEEAEDALDQAAEALEEGTNEPLLEGRLWDVHASLLMDQRNLGEALDLLSHLHRHYLALGETHLAGRALISKGIALRRDGRPQEAVHALREGLGALDSQRDPTLDASGQQVLLDSMVDAGNFSEAGKLIIESGLRQVLASDPLNLLKVRWVEGKIFAGLGKLQRAQEILTGVKEEFLLRDREYLVAMVGLDLAAVLLRRGKLAEVEALAEEALEIFKDLGVAREALRAVRYLRDACRQRVATVALVQDVVGFLNQLEHQPGLRFSL